MADENQDVIISTPSEPSHQGGQGSWRPSDEPTNPEERLNNFNPIGGYNYVPRFIRQVSDLNYGEVVTHENYNEKLNLNTMQGDYNTEVMRLLLGSNGSEDSPRIPYLDQLVYDLNIVKANKSELSNVAYTGSYNDLKDIPNTVLSINGVEPDEETGAVTLVPSDIGAVNKSSYDSDKTKINSDIENVSNEVSKVDSKLNTTDNNLSSLTTDVHNNYATKVNVEENIENVSNEISKVDSKLNNTDNNLSSLTNDIYNNYATKANVKEAIDSLGPIQVVRGRVDTKEQLPTNAKPGDVWLVGRTTEEDKYEYLMTTSGWEVLGKATEVDLSNYYTKAETNSAVSAATNTAISTSINTLKPMIDGVSTGLAAVSRTVNTKQDKLTAGDNITIDENNVISATSGGMNYDDLGLVEITDANTILNTLSTGNYYLTNGAKAVTYNWDEEEEFDVAVPAKTIVHVYKATSGKVTIVYVFRGNIIRLSVDEEAPVGDYYLVKQDNYALAKNTIKDTDINFITKDTIACYEFTGNVNMVTNPNGVNWKFSSGTDTVLLPYGTVLYGKHSSITSSDNVCLLEFPTGERYTVKFIGQLDSEIEPVASGSTDYRILDISGNDHIDIEALERGTYLMLPKQPTYSFNISIYIDYTDTDGTKKSKYLDVPKMGYTLISVTNSFSSSSNTTYAYIYSTQETLGTNYVSIQRNVLEFVRKNDATTVKSTYQYATPMSPNSNYNITGVYKFSTIPEVDILERVITKDTQFTNKKYVDEAIQSSVGDLSNILQDLDTGSGV